MNTDEAWMDLRDWVYGRENVLDPKDVLDKFVKGKIR